MILIILYLDLNVSVTWNDLVSVSTKHESEPLFCESDIIKV